MLIYRMLQFLLNHREDVTEDIDLGSGQVYCFVACIVEELVSGDVLAKLSAVEQVGMKSQYRIFGKWNTWNGLNLNRLSWSKRSYGHLVKIIFGSAV